MRGCQQCSKCGNRTAFYLYKHVTIPISHDAPEIGIKYKSKYIPFGIFCVFCQDGIAFTKEGLKEIEIMRKRKFKFALKSKAKGAPTGERYFSLARGRQIKISS